MDALRAAAAVGVERDFLREALAAAVVKEEADRETFDEIFDRFFAVADAASVEGGRLVPDRPVDFHALSDLGRVLGDLVGGESSVFTRSTVLLVLGDARNN